MIKIHGSEPLSQVSEAFKTKVNQSSREFLALIDVYFDGELNPPTTFQSDDIVMFTLLEEFCSNERDFLGTVSANEFDLILKNSNRELSPTNVESPYYGKLLPKVKVVPYIGLHNGVEEEYICLGKFWSGDWISPSHTLETLVPCYDLMYFIGQVYIPGIEAVPGVTLRALLSKAFIAAGLAKEDFVIESLNFPIDVGWVPEGKLKQVVQTLIRGIAYLDTTRDGKIRIRPISLLQQATPVESMDEFNQIVHLEIPTKFLELHSKVTVRQYRARIEQDTVLLRIEEKISANSSEEFVNVRFSTVPMGMITHIELIDSQGTCSLINKQYTSWNVSFDLVNSGGLAADVEIIVHGKPIDLVPQDRSAVKQEVWDIVGEKELVVDNELIQTKLFAEFIRDQLFILTSRPIRSAIALVTGNPLLTVGSCIEVHNTTDKYQPFIGTIVKRTLTYQGAIEENYVLFKSTGEEEL